MLRAGGFTRISFGMQSSVPHVLAVEAFVGLLASFQPSLPVPIPLELELDPLQPSAIVADIVYVPLMTPLLERARSRGLRTVGGLGMLLHQAAPGFERWFGVRPTISRELRALVEADILAAVRDRR